MFPEIRIDEDLSLVPISARYRNEIFREFDNEIVKYLLVEKAPANIKATDDFISTSIKQMQAGTDLVWVILCNGEFCGCCGVHNIKSKTPHFGIWLKKDSQGKGIGSKVVSYGTRWAADNLDVEYIKYPVDENNIPSIRLIEKLTKRIYRRYKMGERKILKVNEYRIHPGTNNMS